MTTLTLLAATLTTLSLPDGYITLAKQEGLASVYWPGDGQCGKERADAIPFRPEQCHLAHREWPLGARVRVCSRETKKCAYTRVRDRGPYGACDARGIDPKTHKCRGQWLLKIKRSDPGVWRGVADLTRCVWRRIGGPSMQRVTLERITSLVVFDEFNNFDEFETGQETSPQVTIAANVGWLLGLWVKQTLYFRKETETDAV